MIDMEAILNQLNPERINVEILMKHDVARETYQPLSLECRDGNEFQQAVTRYVQHHQQVVGEGTPSEDSARALAKSILDAAFSDDPFQEGYLVAEQLAIDGKLHEVLNELHSGLRGRAQGAYFNGVYLRHLDPLSRSDNIALSEAFYERYKDTYARAGIVLERHSFMGNSRALFEYLRQILDFIGSRGRRAWGRP